jgi:hypothetical protein
MIEWIRKAVAERVATEEAAMRLVAVVGVERFEAAMVEVERRERLFDETQRTGLRSMSASPKRAALDSVCQDVMRGYWTP